MVKNALGLYTALPSDIQSVVDEQMVELWRREYDRCLSQVYCAAALMRLKRQLRRSVDPYERTLYTIIGCGGEDNRRTMFPHAFLVLSGLSASVMRTLAMFPTCLKRRCPLISKWAILNARGALLAGAATLLSEPARRTLRAYDIHRSQCVAWREHLRSFVDGMVERKYAGVDTSYLVEVSLLSGCFRRMQSAFTKSSCKEVALARSGIARSFFACPKGETIHHI